MTTASKNVQIIEDEFDDQLANDTAEKAGEAAAKAAAETLFQAAQERVPIDTGALSASGQVSGQGLEWAVSYGEHYGPILRGHPEWNYQGGRSGRWLDEAIEASGSSMESDMGKAAEAEWPGG